MFTGSKGNIENHGSNGVNNTGSNNIISLTNNIVGPVKILNRTYLYEFCLRFSEIEDSDGMYSTEVATAIEDKMEHNEIILYKDIFLECDHYVEDVELILQDIPKRQRILISINTKYKRYKQFESWTNKDELCEMVYRSLKEAIENDENSKEIYLEDAELAIHTLMYYAFTKCKLLDPILTKVR